MPLLQAITLPAFSSTGPLAASGFSVNATNMVDNNCGDISTGILVFGISGPTPRQYCWLFHLPASGTAIDHWLNTIELLGTTGNPTWTSYGSNDGLTWTQETVSTSVVIAGVGSSSNNYAQYKHTLTGTRNWIYQQFILSFGVAVTGFVSDLRPFDQFNLQLLEMGASGAPTGCIAYNNNGSIQIMAGALPGNYTYDIARSTSPGAESFGSPLVTGLAVPSYLDSSVSVNQEYYYLMRGVSGGVATGASNEAGATVYSEAISTARVRRPSISYNPVGVYVHNVAYTVLSITGFAGGSNSSGRGISGWLYPLGIPIRL